MFKKQEDVEMDDVTASEDPVEESEQNDTTAMIKAQVKNAIDIAIPVFLIFLCLLAKGKIDDPEVIPEYTLTNCHDNLITCFDPTDLDSDYVAYPCVPGDDSMSEFCTDGALDVGAVWVDGSTVLDSIENLDLLTQPVTYAVCPELGWDAYSEVFPSLSGGWKTVLALIPFVLVFQGILSLGLSSRYVAPFVLFVTILLGMNFFRDSEYFLGDSLPTATGKIVLIIFDRAVWTIVDYALNVATAFFLLRVLQLWGVVDAMKEDFELIAPNPTRKVLLVAFCFAISLAVVAPGGSNFVIAGAILISMNIMEKEPEDPERIASNERIGALCLFGNALTSAFNLLGVCVYVIAEDIAPLHYNVSEASIEQTNEGAKQVARAFSAQFFLLSMLAPVFMAFIFNGEETFSAKLEVLKPDLPICLSTGFVYALVQLLVSALLGPQLPCLLAGGAATLFYVLMEKRSELSLSCPSGEQFKRRLYMVPFILLVVLLLLIGVVPGVEELLEGKDTPAETWLSPYVINIDSDNVSFDRQFPWLTHSALIVFWVGVITPFVVPYTNPTKTTMTGPGIENTYLESTCTDKKGLKELTNRLLKRLQKTTKIEKPEDVPTPVSVLKTALSEAIGDVLPVIFSITSFASIAKLMQYFEMTASIANTFVGALENTPWLYSVVAPMIGMLGSGLTGSTTTSNFLFGRLQVSTAQALGLVTSSRNSVWEIGGIQILGATSGEIISPMNAVVITLMDGVNSSESGLIKRLLPIAGFWVVATILMSMLFLLPQNVFFLD